MSQLGEQRFLKSLGTCFFLALGPQSNISTLSTLAFLLLEKCEFALQAMHCCVIRTWSTDFNPSSYLQLWISCVHQSCTAGTSLGEELIRLSSLGAGDLILGGLTAFKICHVASYGWAMVFEIFVKVTWLRCHHTTSTYVSVKWILSKSCDDFMTAAYLRVWIRNSMSSRKSVLKNC